MNVEQMRSEISKVYPWPTWEKRVERMHIDQVVAIYHSFLKGGQFDIPKVAMPRHIGRKGAFEQMSMFRDHMLGYDESACEDHTAVVVGKRRDSGVIEVSQVLYDEDAMLYLERKGRC